MELLTVTFKGYNAEMDRRVMDLLPGVELCGAGYCLISGTRDMQFTVDEFDPTTTGAALTALGVEWGTRMAD